MRSRRGVYYTFLLRSKSFYSIQVNSPVKNNLIKRPTSYLKFSLHALVFFFFIIIVQWVYMMNCVSTLIYRYFIKDKNLFQIVFLSESKKTKYVEALQTFSGRMNN